MDLVSQVCIFLLQFMYFPTLCIIKLDSWQTYRRRTLCSILIASIHASLDQSPCPVSQFSILDARSSLSWHWSETIGVSTYQSMEKQTISTGQQCTSIIFSALLNKFLVDVRNPMPFLGTLKSCINIPRSTLSLSIYRLPCHLCMQTWISFCR